MENNKILFSNLSREFFTSKFLNIHTAKIIKVAQQPEVNDGSVASNPISLYESKPEKLVPFTNKSCVVKKTSGSNFLNRQAEKYANVGIKTYEGLKYFNELSAELYTKNAIGREITLFIFMLEKNVE